MPVDYQPGSKRNSIHVDENNCHRLFIANAFVVHTALRIEYVNEQMGTFLPRMAGFENEAWDVPEVDQAMNFVNAQIAKQRANIYVVEHPGEELPPMESFIGEPYNERETSFINRHKRDHATFKELHWWVHGVGALQFGLAPLALVGLSVISWQSDQRSYAHCQQPALA